MYRFISIAMILGFLVSCSKKTEFLPFGEPKFIIPLTKDRISIFATPDAKETFRTVSQYNGYLETDGVLRLIPQNKETVENFFIQIICPADWKCPENKAFIRRNELSIASEFKYGKNDGYALVLIVPKVDVDRLKITADYLSNLTQEFPKTGLDGKVFQSWVAFNYDLGHVLPIKVLLDAFRLKKTDPRAILILKSEFASQTLVKLASLTDEGEIKT